MYANTEPPLVPAHREGVLCEPVGKQRDVKNSSNCGECFCGFDVKLTVREEGVSKVERPYEAGERVVGGASLDLPLDRSQLHLRQLRLQASVGILKLLREKTATEIEIDKYFRGPTKHTQFMVG